MLVLTGGGGIGALLWPCEYSQVEVFFGNRLRIGNRTRDPLKSNFFNYSVKCGGRLTVNINRKTLFPVYILRQQKVPSTRSPNFPRGVVTLIAPVSETGLIPTSCLDEARDRLHIRNGIDYLPHTRTMVQTGQPCCVCSTPSHMGFGATRLHRQQATAYSCDGTCNLPHGTSLHCTGWDGRFGSSMRIVVVGVMEYVVTESTI